MQVLCSLYIKNGVVIDFFVNQVIVVQGPTASGKTWLAIELAKNFNTEIISADSRQFYQEMTIGTAKPNDLELKAVKHHFINCASVSEEISAARFLQIAEPVLQKLLKENGFAIVVGGSGMFVDALIDGLDEIPVDRSVRDELTKEFNANGLTTLLQELEEKDSEYFQKVDRENPVRVIRALEAIRVSGKKMTDFQINKNKSRDFKVTRLAIDWPRDELYNRINLRVDQMVVQGLFQEVESLFEYRLLNSLNTVGYKEIFEYFDGRRSKDQSIELIKQHTRNYAKRQLTWLRRYNDLHFLYTHSSKSIFEQARDIIEMN
jgi:tRNA dimethylallyltransferase